MKKIFLIFALTALMSLGLIAEENKKYIVLNNREWTYEINGKEYKTDITSFDNPAKEIKDQPLEQITFTVPQKNQNEEILSEIYVTTTPAISVTNLADSFIAAFGMEVDAGGGSGDVGPGMGEGSSGGTMAVGTSTISTTSINQVTPPFTPYSYQK